MAKVTSRYQVTVPRSIAERYGIHPGDDIQRMPAGDVIRVPAAKSAEPDITCKLRLFDQATKRYKASANKAAIKPADRGWTREDLYRRGRSR